MKHLKLTAGFLTGLLMVLAYAGAFAYFSPFDFALSFVVVFAMCLVAGAANIKGSFFDGLGQVGARMMFENARTMLQSMENPNTGMPYNLSQAKMTMSYIRGEIPLDTGKAMYTIPIIENARLGTPRVNENLVALQDVLVVNQVGLFIGIGAGTASDTSLYTYGNQIAFSTAGAAAALKSIYNGKMVLLNNNEQVVPAWDLSRHFKVPAIQAISALYYAGAAVQGDQLDLGCDGFYPNEPGWVINGAGKMQLQIQAGTAPAAIQANSFICVILRGILFQNVTSVK